MLLILQRRCENRKDVHRASGRRVSFFERGYDRIIRIAKFEQPRTRAVRDTKKSIAILLIICIPFQSYSRIVMLRCVKAA